MDTPVTDHGLMSDPASVLGSVLVIGGGIGGMQTSLDLAGVHIMAIEWEAGVRPIVEGAGLYPRPPMDTFLQSLGAETVDWSYKTDCCGGSLSVTQTELALDISEAIITDAKACGAEAIITICPMCHMNLDARQADMKARHDMPIFHSTQLATLAFGLDVKESHFNKNIVDPIPLLKEKELLMRPDTL